MSVIILAISWYKCVHQYKKYNNESSYNVQYNMMSMKIFIILVFDRLITHTMYSNAFSNFEVYVYQSAKSKNHVGFSLFITFSD